MFFQILIYIVGVGLPMLDAHCFPDPFTRETHIRVLITPHRAFLHRGLGEGQVEACDTGSARGETDIRNLHVSLRPLCTWGLTSHTSCRSISSILMNFYFEAAKTLDRLDAKQGSIKGIIGTLPEKDRKRTSALVIETLKCVYTSTSFVCRVS